MLEHLFLLDNMEAMSEKIVRTCLCQDRDHFGFGLVEVLVVVAFVVFTVVDLAPLPVTFAVFVLLEGTDFIFSSVAPFIRFAGRFGKSPSTSRWATGRFLAL